METAYREMQFATISHHVKSALYALQKTLEEVDNQKLDRVLAGTAVAAKHVQLASFHADHLLLLSEQDETVLLEVPNNGRANDCDNASPRTS
jgi:hypothetical protein